MLLQAICTTAATAQPRTIVVDTWEAFDDKMTFNLGGDIASFGDDAGVVAAMSRADRLDWCLDSVREAMEAAEAEASGRDGWILKASTLNKVTPCLHNIALRNR
jgi:hypothetical protein